MFFYLCSCIILPKKNRDMEIGEIIGYALSALGGGGIATVFNWRINRSKAKEEVKSDALENIRKEVEVYQTIIADQNKRIAELTQEVDALRKEKREAEIEHQRQISNLQKQIVEITKALGIKANERIRDEKTGRFIKGEKCISF